MILLEITPYGYGFIGLIVFSIWAAVRIQKRMRTKADKDRRPGCLVTGYISLVVFCIGLFSVGITAIFVSSTVKNFIAITNGEKCEAKVVSWTDEWKEDDEGNNDLYYTPVLEFATSDGTVVNRNTGFSSTEEPYVGQSYTIYYNAGTGSLFVWSYHVVIMFFGMLFMGTILIFTFYGIIRYTLGYNMDVYWNVCKNVGMIFLIPSMMIAFDALLIFALVYKSHPLWVTLLLCFFIFVLTLGIAGYLKMIIRKGSPKWKRTSATTWAADWDEEDEDNNDDEEDDWDEEDDTIEKDNSNGDDPYNKEADNYQKTY